MKWYFACRTRHTEKLIGLSKLLESKGETINSDWIYIGTLKPFEEHLEEVRSASTRCTEAVLDADVFVLISDPEGTDMYAELGMALTQRTLTGSTPRIYAVGEHGRRSVMQLHPFVTHVDTLVETFAAEKISIDAAEIPKFD